MKILMNCVEAGFAIVALMLVCLFCTYAWPESAYGLAGWVQAIGSILSILASYFLGERQGHLAQRQAEEKDRKRAQDKINNIFAVLEACQTEINRLNDIYPLIASGKLTLALHYEEKVFSSLIAALTSFSLASLPSAGAIREMVSAQQALTFLKSRIDTFRVTSVPAADVLYGGTSIMADQSLNLGGWKTEFQSARKSLIKELDG